MARQRRGGFKAPEVRGTLGTLLRTTLQQAGAVRDALERGAREGRSRLDGVRAGRRRQEALAELGELVLELIRTGEIDLAELPEAAELVRHLDELDANDAPDDEIAQPSSRRRFDERAPEPDGTVSSSSFPPAATTRRPGRPTNVWRPPVAVAASQEPPTNPGHKALKPNDPQRRGGIQFDDDEDDDLAAYMHPDDVPPKPPTDGA